MFLTSVSSLCLLMPVATVVVGGETTCPTPARVAEKLRAMSEGEGRAALSPAPGRTAVLSRNKAGLVVTLRSADDDVLAQRQFEARASCEDLAAAAAVVVASWEGELRSEGIEGISSFALKDAPVLPPSPRPAGRLTVDVGAAVELNRAGSSSAPGAWALASVGRRDRPLRLAVALFSQAQHALALGTGEARWRRTGLAIGPRLESQRGRAWAAVEVSAYAGYLQLEGQGQGQNQRDVAWDAGAMSALRLGWRWKHASPWLSFGGSISPITRVVVVEPATESRLPAFALSLMAGFSWRFDNSSSD